MGSSFWSGLACHSWSIAAGSSSARGPRCRISFFVWVSAAPEPPLFGTERAVETSCADSGATVNAFSGAAPCCRVFDRGGRGRTRDFAPSCPSAATLLSTAGLSRTREIAPQKWVSSTSGALDWILRGRFHMAPGTIQAGDGEMTPDVIALSRIRNTSMLRKKRTISRLASALVDRVATQGTATRPSMAGSVDVPLLEDRPSLRVVVDGPRVSEPS
jgi:hypothetical protein